MKAKDLRKKSKEELQKILQENRDKLRKIRFDLTSGKIKNFKEIDFLRKDIARILTILKEIK